MPCILGAGPRRPCARGADRVSRDKRRAYRERGRQARCSAPSRARRSICPRARRRSASIASKQLLQRYGVPVVEEKLLQPAEIEALQAAPFAVPGRGQDRIARTCRTRPKPAPCRLGITRSRGPQAGGARSRRRRAAAQAGRAHRRRAGAGDGGAAWKSSSARSTTACFGPVVAFGLGGIFTELLKDVTHRFAPFDAETAREMIGEIKGAALLTGYRGRPALDVAALADALARRVAARRRSRGSHRGDRRQSAVRARAGRGRGRRADRAERRESLKHEGTKTRRIVHEGPNPISRMNSVFRLPFVLFVSFVISCSRC